MVEVKKKTEPKTRVKECQGYGGARRDKERENEWEEMAGNCRKDRGGGGGRYEGRRDGGSEGVITREGSPGIYLQARMD